MNFLQKAAYKYVQNLFDDYRVQWMAGETHEEEAVNSDMALKYSAVFGCCRVLGETFASVPIVLYKKKDKDREAVTDLPVYDILHTVPNDEMSAFNCRESMMNSINLGGNAVCEKLVNKSGELVGIYPYPHTMVKPDRDKGTNKLIYPVGNGTDRKILRRDQVLHVPGMSLDGVIGLSPISYAAAAIKLGLTYEKFGVKFFKNAANPSGAFKHPGKLDQPEFDRLKKDIREKYSGLENSGLPLLLEGGMDWIQFTVNPTDAQLLESKNFQIEDICRIYRVPQHLVNKLDRSTNNNIEEQALEFVVYTMLPIFKRFEECYNAQLLTREQRSAGYFLEHKVDGLLRGNSTARAALYANGRQWGWLCANDIRRLENLPPIPNGDRFLEPSNMIEAGSNQANAVNAKVLEEIYNILKEKGVA